MTFGGYAAAAVADVLNSGPATNVKYVIELTDAAAFNAVGAPRWVLGAIVSTRDSGRTRASR